MNTKTIIFNILYVILIIFVISMCIYVIHILRSESKECLSQPFLYGAKKMGNVSCTCFQKFSDSSIASFTFNESGFFLPTLERQDSSPYFGHDLPNITFVK